MWQSIYRKSSDSKDTNSHRTGMKLQDSDPFSTVRPSCTIINEARLGTLLTDILTTKDNGISYFEKHCLMDHASHKRALGNIRLRTVTNTKYKLWSGPVTKSRPQHKEMQLHDLKKERFSLGPKKNTHLDQFCQEEWSKIPRHSCAKLTSKYREHLAEVFRSVIKCNAPLTFSNPFCWHSLHLCSMKNIKDAMFCRSFSWSRFKKVRSHFKAILYSTTHAFSMFCVLSIF